MKIFNAEIENFYASKIPARRPNSMNNYGDLVEILVRKSGRHDFQQALTIDTCFYSSSHNHGSGKWGPGRCVACLQMGYFPP